MENRAFGERVAAAKREIRSRSVDGIERRTFATDVEARATTDNGWQIVGHGIVYNSLSENLGGFREEISPGAADGLLTDPEIAGLFNHNPDLVLGRVGAGTMRLEDIIKGVRYTIDPPNTTLANDLRVLMERGDVYQSSFAFRIARGGEVWEEDEESGLLIRTITKFSRLYDMSPVTYPAYPAADSGVASLKIVALEVDDEGDVTATEVVVTAPTVERTDDGPAGERVQDGDSEGQQADEFSEREKRAERLRLRIGEPRL